MHRSGFYQIRLTNFKKLKTDNSVVEFKMKCQQVLFPRRVISRLIIAISLLLLLGIIIDYNITQFVQSKSGNKSSQPKKKNETEANKDLYDFIKNLKVSDDIRGNNETGSDRFIVPNIIHYVRFNKTEYTFVDYVCLKAAMRNHRPDNFYIHTDVGESFSGKYWTWIRQDYELFSRIRLIPTELPFEIYGQKLSSKWRFWHGSDIVRIQVVMQYGGIYLDNDVFVINNLDKYISYIFIFN